MQHLPRCHLGNAALQPMRAMVGGLLVLALARAQSVGSESYVLPLLKRVLMLELWANGLTA